MPMSILSRQRRRKFCNLSWIGTLVLHQRYILPLRLLGSLILYSLITVIFFRTLLPHIDTALLGPPEDNLQDFWNSWYAAIGHVGGASFFFTHLIKFPEGTTLYYHSFAYPEVFLVWLATQFFGTSLKTLIVLQNLVLLLSFPLAGVGAFFLARRFTRTTWSALLGGFIFAFNPWHVEQAMHHLHVASIEFIPFFVLSYLLAIEKRSAGWLAAATVFFALSALSCWYYLFYCAYFVVFHTTIKCVQDRALPRGWNMYIPIATIAGVIIILSPLLIPMIRVALTAGRSVYAIGNDIYVADFLGYFSFPPHHILSALIKPLSFSPSPWESTVYLGLANIELSVWLFLKRRKFDAQMITYIAVGIVVFAVLASGSHLRVFGFKILPMPDLLLAKIPFFGNVRTPARSIVFVFLFLSVLVSLAIQLLKEETKSTPTLQRVAIIGILAFIVADFYPIRIDVTPLSCSPGLAVIRNDPERGFGVLDLPGNYVANNAAMAKQICHRRPIVRGVTSRSVGRTLQNVLDTHDLQRQRQQLINAKVKYIILRRANNEIYKWRRRDGVRADYPKVYRVVYKDANLLILKVY